MINIGQTCPDLKKRSWSVMGFAVDKWKWMNQYSCDLMTLRDISYFLKNCFSKKILTDVEIDSSGVIRDCHSLRKRKTRFHVFVSDKLYWNMISKFKKHEELYRNWCWLALEVPNFQTIFVYDRGKIYINNWENHITFLFCQYLKKFYIKASLKSVTHLKSSKILYARRFLSSKFILLCDFS